MFSLYYLPIIIMWACFVTHFNRIALPDATSMVSFDGDAVIELEEDVSLKEKVPRCS